jgi:phage FluMu gp28-like protein
MSTAPPVLLPYQQRWVADLSPFKVGEKTRRCGLTWAEASDDVLIAASDKSAGGQNVYYIGTDKEMTDEYIEACAMWAKAFNHAASAIGEGYWDEAEEEEDKHIKTYWIRFPDSGFRILALASRPRKLRGRQGVLVGDEGAFQDDLPGLIKAGMAFLLWGGKVRIISTHFGESNDFNQLILDIRAGNRKGSVHTITFRQAVAEGLYKRICLRMGKVWTQADEDKWVADTYAYYGDDAPEELDCIPSQGSGLYLPRPLVKQCMREGIPILAWTKDDAFTIDPERLDVTARWIADTLKPVMDNLPGLRSVYGQDFGRDGDLSVIWVLQQTGWRWRMAFALELRKMPFDVQAMIRDFILDNLPLFHHAKFDARGNGQSHAEAALQKYGEARVDCVKATQEWYSIYFPKYKKALESQEIEIADSEDIIMDHRHVVLKKGIPGMDDQRSKGSDGQPRHGDSAIAGLMAWAATLAEGGPLEFESAGGTRQALGAYGSGPDHYAGTGNMETETVEGYQDFDGWNL